MPGSLPHLFARFFDFVFSKPLGEDEIAVVRGWLTPEEFELFATQDVRDQAHGYRSGAFAWNLLPERGDLIRAATLHDVGKRHSHMGAIGRSVASILIKFRLPLTTRMKAYREHGEYGANALTALGSVPVAIEFARSHHRSRPDEIAQEDWDVLQASDAADRTFMSR